MSTDTEIFSISLKKLNSSQKQIVRHLNNQIIEYQNVFNSQPEELLVSTQDYKELLGNKEYNKKYIMLGKIKIYSI